MGEEIVIIIITLNVLTFINLAYHKPGQAGATPVDRMYLPAMQVNEL